MLYYYFFWYFTVPADRVEFLIHGLVPPFARESSSVVLRAFRREEGAGAGAHGLLVLPQCVGTVRLRVEGGVGSLSDASATLSELCFMRALIASREQSGAWPAAGRASNSPSAVGCVRERCFPSSHLYVALGITIVTHYTASSTCGARTPITEMASSA